MAKLTIKRAKRLEQLPPYLFAEIDRMRDEEIARGVDIIDLGVGDPDLPTHSSIVRRLQEASQDPATHRYPAYQGSLSFRKAVSEWFEGRFGISLDPNTEVLALIGSKEGIGHLPLAFVDPGDVVLVPDPGYPVYKIGTIFAGGEPVTMPLLEENGFLPDLRSIGEKAMKRAKLLYINYPNNPTAAVADPGFFTEVVEFARERGLIVCHDAAYCELTFDGFRSPSILQVKGARDLAVEFHSLSKTYNMTGWRIGMAVGNPHVLKGLGSIKSNLDSGTFQAVQEAGIQALTGDQSIVAETMKIYERRRNILVDGLNEMGLKVEKPKGSFYIWARVPEGSDSTAFTGEILRQAGVVATPGVGFGPHGEGYIRFTLCAPEARLEEAVERLKKVQL